MVSEAPVDLTKGTYRRIYSGFITGRKICRVSIEAEAWFWRIQAIADDFGNLPGDVREVWLKTIGHRDVSVQRVEKWVAELVNAGLLVPYSVGGEPYLHIAFWSSETWPAPKNGRRARKVAAFEGMVNPGESGGIRVNPGATTTHQDQDQDQDQDQNQTHTLPAEPVGFERFWNAYPYPGFRRIDRKQCLAIWKADKLEAQTDAIVAYVKAASQTDDWLRENGRFVLQAPRFLKRARWRDGALPTNTDDPPPRKFTEAELKEAAAFRE